MYRLFQQLSKYERKNLMFDNEKLAYDLALIYAKTKFESAIENGDFCDLHNQQEMELKSIAVFFNDAYSQYLSCNLSDFIEL